MAYSMMKLRKAVVKLNQSLGNYELSPLTWGNASIFDREKGIIGIKPSGVDYDKLTPESIVLLNREGQIIEGNLNPSTDTATHIEIYKGFPKITAIVHTHSPNATAFAQARTPVKCLGTTHGDHFYGEVPVIDMLDDDKIHTNYEKNTGKAIVKYFRKHNISPLEMFGCLLPSHGPFVWGVKAKDAYYNATVLELIAKMNLTTIQINPKIKPIKQFLLDKHFLRKHGINAYYGQEQAKNN